MFWLSRHPQQDIWTTDGNSAWNRKAQSLLTPRACTFGNQKFVCVGDGSSRAAVSADSEDTWNSVSLGSVADAPFDVVFVPSTLQWVGVGSITAAGSSMTLYTSVDPQTTPFDTRIGTSGVELR